MPTAKEKNTTYLLAFFPAMFLLALNVYRFGYSFFQGAGWTHPYLDSFCTRMDGTGLMAAPWRIKLVCVMLLFFCSAMRFGRRTKMGWGQIALANAVSAAVFFLPPVHPLLYVTTSIAGFVAVYLSISLVFRKLTAMKSDYNNPHATFKQCEELIETPDSVNFKTRYFYNKRWRTGYINVVNPFRGNIIFGVPGSGKTFSILYEYMIQLTEKGFCSFTYDFKYPELTKFMYSLFLKHKDEFAKKYGDVEFISINFMDPRYSYRVNPLDPVYIRDLSDATETSTVIMKSVNPNAFSSGKDDFWTQSAINLWDSIIWYLHEYQYGRYCTFPHFIEMLTYSYKDLIELLLQEPALKSRAESFRSAMDKSEEMLQSQISTARQPLIKMANEGLYWIFSKNEFYLDINNPKKPKFICIGNFPERQNIYSTALSLITARVFPIINKPGGVPCAVFGDEIPTVTMKGLDTLIATARSNRVAVVLAAQDRAQLEKLWGRDEARSTLNIFGNHFYGQMIGDNVRQISDLFGSEYREHQSESVSDNSTSVSTSFQLEKRLPENKIATLSQGEFAAMISDDFETQIDYKQSCSYIQVDLKKRAKIKEYAAELPMVNRHDFHCAIIENKIRKEPEKHIIDYITDELVEEEKVRQRLELIQEPIYRDELERQATVRVKKMNSKEREEILKKCIAYFQEEEMKKVLRENKKRITDEIETIMRTQLRRDVKKEETTELPTDLSGEISSMY